MKSIFIIAVSSLLLFSSCHEIFAKRIRGNGNIITQDRSTGQFNNINVSGNIDVYAKQDSAAFVKVETDENLLQYVEIIDDGEVLRIHTKRGFYLKPSQHIKVYVSSPSFKRFEASGACSIFSENQITSADPISIDISGACGVSLDLNAPKINVDASGASSIKLKGQVKDFKVGGSGSTDIKCMDLQAENVILDISGAGDAEVYANAKLNVDVSGAADVRYKGNAAVTEHKSGAGSIKKVE